MKHLAFAADCNGRLVELAPHDGAAMAVAEVCRNLVCSGAEPIGITDCLNFASPEDPGTMHAFSEAIDGLAAACNALRVPIVSGNVSLYNETSDDKGRHPILPTPTVAAVGLFSDSHDILTQHFRAGGDAIVLIEAPCDNATALGASEYQALKTGQLGGPIPRINLEAEAALQRFILDLARSRLLHSAHDISDGGVAVALAECCSRTDRDGPNQPAIGAEVTLALSDGTTPVASTLFGESPSRVLVSLSPDHVDALISKARDLGLKARSIGRTLSNSDRASLCITLEGGPQVHASIEDIDAARAKCLEPIVGAT